MKNSDGTHTVVLTDRAVRALRAWVRGLHASPTWRGPATPLFTGPDGRVVTNKWLNEVMKRVAAIAGVQKRVTSHVYRHTAGTLIGRENPKLAV